MSFVSLPGMIPLLMTMQSMQTLHHREVPTTQERLHMRIAFSLTLVRGVAAYETD